jgi:hypothetical protein
MLPCCPDGCSCLPIYVFVKEIWFLVELWWASRRVAMMSGRMQPWTFKSSWHWWASGRMSGPFGRNLGIQLYWVGIFTESSFEHLEPLFWNEDFEINGIPDYVATLHNSDFVKQNAANHKLTIDLFNCLCMWNLHILLFNNLFNNN